MNRDRNLTRRLFLGAAAPCSAALAIAQNSEHADAPGHSERARKAYEIRVEAARLERDAPEVSHPNNGDEQNFANKIGSYSKGLPHDSMGEVNAQAYAAFAQALDEGGLQSAIEQVPMGSVDRSQQRKFVDPCAGACFELEGADSHHLSLPAAPSVASREAAGEMVELYWQALARDVPFTQYDSDPMAKAAAAELSALSDFRGPRTSEGVTPATLFRGSTGDAAGPYISQFLLKPVPFGPQYVDQKLRTAIPGVDFLTQYSDWLTSQNGTSPGQSLRLDSTRRYIRTGRDLGVWVRGDVLYQAYFNAMLIMVQPPDSSDEMTGGGMGVPLNPGNPYKKSTNQEGFATFGPPAIATAVAENAARALKAVWYQKWFVHRRLRPEAYGGLVHNTAAGNVPYAIHDQVLRSEALNRVHAQHGTYLLPMAYPEGSPLHPSYGAGHATVAGASITVLKAVFDESFIIPNPVVPSADGLSLVPYGGPDASVLTVGGELNKLASNIAVGRNFAGVHWRSDFSESILLGEALAISVLKEQRLTYGQNFEGYTFTRLDGTKVTV